MGMAAHHFATFWWLETSHRSHPHGRGRNETKMWTLGGSVDHGWGCILESICLTNQAPLGTLLIALWQPRWEGNPKRGDTCVHIANSLCCTVETSTTLQSNYTPIKINLRKEVKLADILIKNTHTHKSKPLQSWSWHCRRGRQTTKE